MKGLLQPEQSALFCILWSKRTDYLYMSRCINPVSIQKTLVAYFLQDLAASGQTHGFASFYTMQQDLNRKSEIVDFLMGMQNKFSVMVLLLSMIKSLAHTNGGHFKGHLLIQRACCESSKLIHPNHSLDQATIWTLSSSCCPDD